MSRPDCSVEIKLSELSEIVLRHKYNQTMFLFRESSNEYTIFVEIDHNSIVMIRYPSESEVESLESLSGITDLRKYKV